MIALLACVTAEAGSHTETCKDLIKSEMPYSLYKFHNVETVGQEVYFDYSARNRQGGYVYNTVKCYVSFDQDIWFVSAVWHNERKTKFYVKNGVAKKYFIQ
jgi:hypothetical protein|tara:strand:+ start:241 stop:543 length:303 start_codon:yes stop_codon:yes gene_type:complete